jgi:hypothetical protein
MTDEPLQGLVAQIINTRELIINIGNNKNVKTGMKFKVLERSSDIQDPITHQSLGNYEREKIKVKIVEVYDKFSIASTYVTYEEEYYSGSNAINALSLMNPFTSGSSIKVQTLKASDNQAPYDPLDETGSFVKIGDPVVQLL